MCGPQCLDTSALEGVWETPTLTQELGSNPDVLEWSNYFQKSPQ